MCSFRMFNQKWGRDSKMMKNNEMNFTFRSRHI